MELGHESGAEADHDATQHDHAQDAPEQDPMLVGAGNAEIRENDADDEDVVHRETLLDGVARQVLHARVGAEIPPDEAPVGDAEADVEQ